MAQVAPLKLGVNNTVAQMVAGTDSILPGTIGTGTANASVFLRGDGTWAKQLDFNGTNGATVSMLTLNTGTQSATAVWSANVLTFRNTAGILGHVGMYGDGSVAMLGLWAQDGATPTVQVRATGEMRLGSTATSHIRFGTAAYGLGLLAVSGVGDPVTTLYASSAAGSSGLALGFYNGTTFVRRFDIDINGKAVVTGTLGVNVTPQSSWGASAIQLGTRAALYGITGGGAGTQLANNSYYNGTNHLYLETAAAAVYTISGGGHTWSTAPSGTAAAAVTYTGRMSLDNAGRLGLGVTPSAWGADTVVMQIGASSSFASIQSVSTSVGENVHWDGANWKYLRTAQATNFYLQDGFFVWRSAASGTAGTNISFTERMRLAVDGQLTVGTSLFTGSMVRIQGAAGAAPTGSSGVGLEIFMSGSAYIQAFDRTSTAYAPLQLVGSSFAFGNGRALFSASNEPYGIGIRYVGSGGPIYLGATDATAGPGWQLSNSSGVSLIQGTNGGLVAIPGSLSVGSVAAPRERVDVTGSIITSWGDCKIGMQYLDGLNYYAGLSFNAGARSVDLRSMFNDSGYITLSVGTAGGTFAERMRVDTSSVRVTGNFDIQYTAGYTATRLVSYQHGLSLWILQPAGTQMLMLGEQLNYDYAVAIQYTGGTIGAGAGVLRIGQLGHNSGWTHGITEMWAGGGPRLVLDNMGVKIAGRLAPNAVTQLTSATWDWGATSYHSYTAAGGSFTSITNAKDGEMKRIDVQGAGSITISATGFVWAPGHPVWGTSRTLVTVVRLDATPTYVGVTNPVN